MSFVELKTTKGLKLKNIFLSNVSLNINHMFLNLLKGSINEFADSSFTEKKIIYLHHTNPLIKKDTNRGHFKADILNIFIHHL